MKVFRVRLDVNRYQSFYPVREDEWYKLNMDCAQRKQWVPPSVYVLHPKLIAGNFYQYDGSTLITDSNATEHLRDYLEMAGELLHLPHQEESYTLLNVLECINALDEERTHWIYGETTGAKIKIEQYHFHPNRFGESVLFKIPETSRAEVLLVEGMRDEEEEFRYIVEQNNLRGLLFEEIWSY